MGHKFAALLILAAGCGGTAVAPQAAPATTDASNAKKPEAPRLNYVFVTSTGHSADFGGVAGADAFCAARAKKAGLSGENYVAWLSTSTASAASRLAGARGWMRTDGAPVFDTVDDVTSNQLFHPIRLDEKGNDVIDGSDYGFIPVWTGTDLDGALTPGTYTCSDWTSVAENDAALTGDAAGGSTIWNWGAQYACEGWELPVYCFETDFNVPLDTPKAPAGARVAFLSQPFTLRAGGSIADADAQCAAEATHAGLAGSFKALLADVGRSAASRFDDHKSTWYRLDGVAIVDRAQDLFASGGPRLNAPIDLQADGGHAAVLAPAWTGFSGDVDDYSRPGTAATTCNGWSSTSATQLGRASIADFTFKSFRNVEHWPLPTCAEAAQLYCLQE